MDVRNVCAIWCSAWFLALAPPGGAQQPVNEIPVTIKELDVTDTIREFRRFERQLEKYRADVSVGQKVAADTASILDDLRRTASKENGYNEKAILGAIHGYVSGVVAKQADLVDFLQSQRYRITYYANRMAATVEPEDIADLFGTERSNLANLRNRTRQLNDASAAITAFIDGLSPEEFDRTGFQALPGLSSAKRRRLARLELRYQNAKNTLDISKSRLRLVREARRASVGTSSRVDLNVDVLLGQMFGTLDRIRLQMSRDLLYLETFLSRYERSARTQEILRALQHLVSLQGGMQGPSRGLANILDWLEDSSVRKLSPGLEGLEGKAAIAFPRSSDLLREAYSRGVTGSTRKKAGDP